MAKCDILDIDIIDAFINMSAGTKGGVTLEYLWSIPIDRYLLLIERYNLFAKKQ